MCSFIFKSKFVNNLVLNPQRLLSTLIEASIIIRNIFLEHIYHFKNCISKIGIFNSGNTFPESKGLYIFKGKGIMGSWEVERRMGRYLENGGINSKSLKQLQSWSLEWKLVTRCNQTGPYVKPLPRANVIRLLLPILPN